MHDLLARLGLTDNAARVYLSLVGAAPRTIAAIAKAAGIHRPAVYRAIAELEKRGLVSAAPKGRRTLYAAESPEKLAGLARELQDELGRFLPPLLERHRARRRRPVVTYGEGKEAITSVLTDLVTSLKKGEVYYRYSSNKYVEDYNRYWRYYPKNYRELRDKKELQRFVITSEASKRLSREYLTRAIKAVPARHSLFEYNITTLIYGDKLAYLDFTNETALVIENRAVAEFQKKLFQILYDRL